MRHIYLLLLLTVFFNCEKKTARIHANEKIEENNSFSIDRTNFEEVVYNVIKFYNQKEEQKLNQLINQKEGIYFILRLGTIDGRFKKSRICFSDCDEKDKIHYPFSEIIREQLLDSTYKISYDSYPDFIFEDCERVTKEGLFVDTLTTDRLLSNTIKNYKNVFLEKELNVTYKELDSEVNKIIKLENSSRKVMLTKNNGSFYGGHFIFYLTKIDNQWWLTIIDFATMDCSV